MAHLSCNASFLQKIPGTATQLARLRANLESMRSWLCPFCLHFITQRERAVSEGAARRPLPKRNITSVSLYDQMPRSPKPASNRRATYQGPDSDNEEGAEEQDPLGVLHLPNPRFTSTSKWATADMRWVSLVSFQDEKMLSPGQRNGMGVSWAPAPDCAQTE
eukprot:scaffold214603_cov18-Tisochrysis_lutea.AAC.3